MGKEDIARYFSLCIFKKLLLMRQNEYLWSEGFRQNFATLAGVNFFLHAGCIDIHALPCVSRPLIFNLMVTADQTKMNIYVCNA